MKGALQRDIEELRSTGLISQRLAAIVQASDDAIVSKNLESIITTWNKGAERIFGYTEEEAVGQPITMLFPPERINEEAGILASILNGSRIEHYETQRRRKDGTLVEVSLTVSPIFAEDGKVIGASKIARDITVRKQQEQALAQVAIELERRVQERTASLQEAVAQMEEISYTISHDLRAPLRGMAMRCRILQEDFGYLFEGEPEANETVNGLAQSCAKLDRMIRDVMAFGKVARGLIEVAPQSLDSAVEETIANHPALQPPMAHVTVEPLGRVLAHAQSLTQTVSNLMLNAAKFVRPGATPEIRLWTEPRGESLRLWVEDNGIGVDPAYQHRLFTMFERIHPDLPYDGNGVGLAIVRRAVERMHGSAGMESDGVNGSRFWIELPVAP